MTILLFLIVLGSLVFVHELGHFVVAKIFGIRVDEFGLGFPPKIVSFKKGETVYSLNIIPFGGFVKIYGEDPEEKGERSFVSKNRWIQAGVLVAGVLCNMLFAWLLISVSFMMGQPTPASYGPVENPQVTVLSVEEGYPAKEAGIKEGDVILAESSESLIESISGEEEVEITYIRGEEEFTKTIETQDGIIGISVDDIGILKLPFFSAFIEGFKTTYSLTKLITVELGKFFGRAFTGSANFSEVTGPVGIISLVGEASRLGLVHLITFTALISIHLAIINLVPFPALDGGRLLFVAIEGITRKTIPIKFFQYANLIGFAILMILMVVVTYNDILGFM
ncbi:MAG: site-2 protease family protein [Candidatus Pacebacteria bacterium]|nr:site-2 protease family protein [Candidatus Paceibacterota bacterium]